MYFCVVLCIVCFVTFPVLFVYICVLYYYHRVATQLQLNISYHTKHENTENDVSRHAVQKSGKKPQRTAQHNLIMRTPGCFVALHVVILASSINYTLLLVL
jgi:hypothetical protein